MKKSNLILIVLFFVVLLLARIILPVKYMLSFSKVLNIVLMFIAAFFSFMILKRSKGVFEINGFMQGWGFITVTLLFFAINEFYSYVLQWNKLVYEENLKLFFYLLMVLGLYNLYHSIERKKNGR